MKSVQCTVQFDEDAMHPVHKRLTTDDSLIRDLLLHTHRTEDGPDTLLFYFEGDRDAYEAVLDATDRIREYDITRLGEEAYYAYVREESGEFDAQLAAALDTPGALVMPPIEFRSDGTARLTLVGEPDALQSAIEDVPADVRVDVTRIGEYDTTPSVPAVDITDRQHEAVETALDVGYYDVPRSGSVAEVADRLGCRPGTASEHLRKAERAVMRAVVESTPR